MRAICTTTIYPPSKALRKFIEIAEQDEWVIFVAGDIKTPHEEYRKLNSDHFHYLSPGDQSKIDFALSEAIGWNCIQRRNMAFLAAYKDGAEIVASVDDDNIPYEGWGRDLMIGRPVKYRHYSPSFAAFDPLSATNHRELWHRGFPIQLLADKMLQNQHSAEGVFDIQADFWDGDPDVDAICRMEHRPECRFDPNRFPFASNKPAPFNSQNTFLLAKVIPHYFMQIERGRSDDVWAAFHVQAQGFKVVFGAPSVVQDRNQQDVMRNFEDELFNYRHNLEIVKQIPNNPSAMTQFLSERGKRAFQLYQAHFK